MNGLRFDDPRVVSVTILGLVAAAFWVATWSLMGSSDYSLLELCRAAITGAPLSAEARENLAILTAALPPEGWSFRLVAETTIMWVLMMAAMMLPAMSSAIAVYADIAKIAHSGALLIARVGMFASVHSSL